MTSMPLAFSILVAGAVLLGFIGLWRLTHREDAVEARLRQYGGAGPQSAPGAGGAARSESGSAA